MAELHSADMDLLSPPDGEELGEDGEREPTVLSSIREWMEPAREVVDILRKAEETEGTMYPEGPLEGWVERFDIEKLEKEVSAYKAWLTKFEKEEKKWRMVFAHNDART
jgi:hypothetical protein